MKTKLILLSALLSLALPILSQEAPPPVPPEQLVARNLAEMEAVAKEMQRAHDAMSASLKDLGVEVATGIAGLDKPLGELLEKVGALLQSAPEARGVLPKEALEGIKIGVTQAKEAVKMAMGQLAQGGIMESILAQSGMMAPLSELAKGHDMLAKEFEATRNAPPGPEREKKMQELAAQSQELLEQHREALKGLQEAAIEIQQSREEVKRELLENQKEIQAEIAAALAEAQGEIVAALANVPKTPQGGMAPKALHTMTPGSPEWKKALEEYIKAVQPNLEAVHNSKALADYGKLTERYMKTEMAPNAATLAEVASATRHPKNPKVKLSVDVVNEDFQSAIVRLARLWGAEVTFDPKAMPQGRVTALLRDKTFQGALDALCKPAKVSYRVESGVYHLSQQKK